MLVRAVWEAKQSSHYRYRFGAVITKRGVLVATGHNVNVTHPLSKHPSQKLHAEVAVIAKALSKRVNLVGSHIYVARVTKTRQQLSAALPCKYCYRLIKQLGIKRIIYTTYTNDFGVVYAG
jgi:deoxycytidylate deaminase